MKLYGWFAPASFALFGLLAGGPQIGAQTNNSQTPPPMSAEQKAAMEAFMKAMTPGPAHKALNTLTGEWTAKVSIWEAPGAPPHVSEGVSVNRWVLGGRYIEQKFTGSFMGQPFEGIGYTGYDNVKKQYWGTWIDSMSTGVMTSVGTGSEGKTMKFDSVSSDPMTGHEMKSTTQWSHGPPDQMASSSR